MDSIPLEILFNILNYIPIVNRQRLIRVSKTFKTIISLLAVPKSAISLTFTDIFNSNYFDIPKNIRIQEPNNKCNRIYCYKNWIILFTDFISLPLYINRYSRLPQSNNQFIPKDTNTTPIKNYYIGCHETKFYYWPSSHPTKGLQLYPNKYYKCIIIENSFDEKVLTNSTIFFHNLNRKKSKIYPTPEITVIKATHSGIRQTTITQSISKILLSDIFNIDIKDKYCVLPKCCSFDKFNNVFVLDQITNTIKKFSQTGKYIYNFTINPKITLKWLEIDLLNRVFISTKQIIQVFDTNKNFLFQIQYTFKSIKQFLFDSYNNLIVLDQDHLIFFDNTK